MRLAAVAVIGVLQISNDAFRQRFFPDNSVAAKIMISLTVMQLIETYLRVVIRG